MGGLDDRSPERLARLRLARLTEPGDQAIAQVVVSDGPVALLERITAADPGLSGVEHYRARIDSDPDSDLQSMAEIEGRFLIPGDEEWPTQLDALEVPPLGLFVVGGQLRLPASRSVAIVGARAATSYGLHVASEFATGLGERGWTTVSGGAYGIDAAAHRGSLVIGGSTIGVLACGVDVRYPRGNATLFDRLVDSGGSLVSELPPGSHPTRPRFLKRNRVIAALARATVVIEAADRSGALNTAAHCRQLGRPLLAVPGPITSPMSHGCHRLLRDLEPARLVTSVDEVIEEAGLIGELAPLPSVVRRVRDALDPVSLRVLEAVPASAPALTQQVAADAGLAEPVVAGALLRLAAAGLVKAMPEGGFCVVREAGDQPVSPG